MEKRTIDIRYRSKDYTADMAVSHLPSSDEQMDSILSLLAFVKKRKDVAVLIRITDEEQENNVPQEILMADSAEGFYLELNYSMDEWDWDHPLLLANDHLTEEEATSVLNSILGECTDANPIIENSFGDISSRVFPEEETRKSAPDKDRVRNLRVKDLEDGSMLKKAIAMFKKEQNEAHLLKVLQLLRDSYVWIPCNVVMSEEDQRAWEEIIQKAGDDPSSLVGTTYTNKGQTRLIPDTLTNGQEEFFPVFSSVEEMGEYGEHFSKIQENMLTVIELARNNQKELAGIVINAFSDPFVFIKELYVMVEKLKSRIVEG